MKNNILNIFIFVLIIALVSGCDKSFSPALREADRLLSIDVKRGEDMLDSICQVEKNMSSADKKYCELLRLKATDKSYRPIDKQKDHVDSLVSYFKQAGDDDLLAESYFYAGRVYYEIGDKPESLKYYQKASEKVGKDNYALQGDIYCQMANVYKYKNLNQEALEALFLAYKADSLSGNARNVLYDIRDIGEEYIEKGCFSVAENYMQTGVRRAGALKDTFMMCCFHHELANICVKTQKWDAALSHVQSYIRFLADIPDKTGMSVTALKVFTHFKIKEQADSFRTLLNKEGNVFGKRYAVENRMLVIAGELNNKEFYSLFRTYKYYTDSIIKESNASAVKNAEQSYNYELKEKENERLHAYNIVQFIGLIMLTTIVGLIILYFHMKRKSLQQKAKILEFKIEKYETLREKTEAKTANELTKNHTIITDSNILKIIKTEIDTKRYKLSDAYWQQLRELINLAYPSFDKNLYSFLEVSHHEYKICLLVKIGISPSNIAHFMNVTKEAITASRRRMYMKSFHRKGSPSDWDDIINSL